MEDKTESQNTRYAPLGHRSSSRFGCPRPGSSRGPLWLLPGSSLAPLWFRTGSCLAPSCLLSTSQKGIPARQEPRRNQKEARVDREGPEVSPRREKGVAKKGAGASHREARKDPTLASRGPPSWVLLGSSLAPHWLLAVSSLGHLWIPAGSCLALLWCLVGAPGSSLVPLWFLSGPPLAPSFPLGFSLALL